jgi:hypothetical protein
MQTGHRYAMISIPHKENFAHLVYLNRGVTFVMRHGINPPPAAFCQIIFG